MAEIEFKRRGTPLWVVVLGVILVALALWFLFGRDRVPAPAATASSTTPAQSTPVVAAPAPAPPAPTGASAQFVEFVDKRPVPGGAEQRAWAAEMVRSLAGATLETFPLASPQVNLMNALADSLANPEVKSARVSDMTQLAFFAFLKAAGKSPVADSINDVVGQMAPNQPLSEQKRAVSRVLHAARDIVKSGGKVVAPARGAAAPLGATPAPAGPPAPASPKP